MNLLIFIRYIHFLGIILIAGALAVELALFSKSMKRNKIKQLFVVDGIYGAAAIAAVGAGFLLWFVVGKPADYYAHNYIFHIKVGLAILLGLLSIIPTVFIFKNRKGSMDDMVEVPGHILIIVKLEVLILLMIPLLAVAMANGKGIF